MLKLLSSQQGKMLTLVGTHTTLLYLLFNSRVNLNLFWSLLGQGFLCPLVSLQLLSIYSLFNSVEVLWGMSSPLLAFFSGSVCQAAGVNFHSLVPDFHLPHGWVL